MVKNSFQQQRPHSHCLYKWRVEEFVVIGAKAIRVKVLYGVCLSTEEGIRRRTETKGRLT